ncbi:MAG: 1-phosphofructokinase family hexose kinase [Acidobacteriota bacterium]
MRGEARGAPAAPIATVTMNPAVDVSTRVARVLAERKMRCGPPRYEPGGGGINVARAIRKLGGEASALFPAGGPAGRLLEDLLSREGVPKISIPIESWTRENLNVLEEETGRQFRFVLPGPALRVEEWRRCFEAIEGFEPFPAFLVASGSLPPGVPEDFYARLAALAKRRGARLALDSSGPALRGAVEEGVYLWKPSLREFQEWTGETSADEGRWRGLAREIVGKGRCEVLVLSLGSGGALWTTRTEQERLTAPAVSVSSSVGAGDSMVAGIVLSLWRGRSLREAVCFGVAAAAAAVMNPGTELCRREDVDRLFGQVVAAPV